MIFIWLNLEVSDEGTDFMVFHGMVKKKKHSEIVKFEKEPWHNLSSVRHCKSVLEIPQGRHGKSRGLFHHRAPLLLNHNLVFPSGGTCHPELNAELLPRHLQSIRVCRMVVACKVSLKQCLNFWTCHLAFLPFLPCERCLSFVTS